MPRPAPNNPNVAKVILTYASDVRQFQNIFHVSATTPWTLPQLQQLATDFINWWNLQLRIRQSVDVALTLVQTRKLDPSSPIGHDQPVIPPIAGSILGNSAPSNATLTLSWRTGLAGRRFRGRTYIPGLVGSDISVDDKASSVLVNQLLVAGTQLITSQLVHGALTVFHAPGDTPSTFDNTFTDVTTAVVENLLDSQRRRLPGRGR